MLVMAFGIDTSLSGRPVLEVFLLGAQPQILEMHVVGEPAVAANHAVHHLLVIAKPTMRVAEIDGDLAAAFWTIAAINSWTHGEILAPAGMASL